MKQPPNAKVSAPSEALKIKTGGVMSADVQALIAAANAAAAAHADEFYDAVVGYADALVSLSQESAPDLERVRILAHDLRGAGGHCGCAAAGLVAGGLCDYVTEVQARGRAIEPALLAAHAKALVLLVRERSGLEAASPAISSLKAAVDHALA